ncbi:MAG: cytochrome-c peroxidase [Nitrospirota bacterium]
MTRRVVLFITLFLLTLAATFASAPVEAARPKKSDAYPPQTLFDTLPSPPFHLYPLLAPPTPAFNLQTPAKIELGKTLFFDPRLSKDNTLACASCHVPALGFSNGQSVAKGVKGQLGTRNVPSLYNVAYRTQFFWDGRATSLEQQALEPIQNPIEMDQDLSQLVAELNAVPGYVKAFRSVFGTGPSADGIAQALTAFERTILSDNSPWDRFMAGDDAALSESAKRGVRIFNERAKCVTCHNGPNFTDNQFHALGLPKRDGVPDDPGRFKVTLNDDDMETFRTPSLRQVADSAPYMHNGMFATLEEVLDFYVKAEGHPAHRHPLITPLDLLTEQDKMDLLAFIRALSSDPVVVIPPPKFK